MEKTKIYLHGSYIGTTGYNNHTRDFLRELVKHTPVKVRNFTVGNTWSGYNLTPHDNEPYINDVDKSMLYKQILWNSENSKSDYIIYPDESKNFKPDLNIVLCETNHHIFYDNYIGPKIAYNVWESTLQPEVFFNKLLEYDEMWVPSKWQRDCTIKQGYPAEKIKVVPEGVDIHTFFPENVTHELTSDGRFKFLLAGRWDYRKSIKEIIESFLKTFDKDEPVDLIISVDNPFSNDGLNSTEERLKHYGMMDDRIKIIHFPPREDYIKLLKSCNCFVSCARSEGWNLPLIESMSCGTPSIYSNCSGQLEFAEGKGIPVKISHELAVSASTYNHFNENVGNYYEPDFGDLSIKMRQVYQNYTEYKEKALKESIQIRQDFSWERVGQIGYNTVVNFMKNYKSNDVDTNEIKIYYNDGPKVEIHGDQDKTYLVEFLDENNNVIHSHTMKNNHWVQCGRKYYTKWKIRINEEIIEELDLKDKRVLISIESSSIGDTVAWAPYAIDFQRKHNCKVILSTFHNKWFEKNPNYQGIEFIEPGMVTNCHALYRIGWFKSEEGKFNKFDSYPNEVQTIPLQQTATDILGLDFKELNYGIYYKKSSSPKDKEYVVLGPNATSGCKEWKYEYWVELSKMIKKLGYEVVTLTKNPYNIEGVENIWGEPMDVVLNYLNHAKAFIGLGSGLSWLNWSLDKHTYMINGFSRPGHEFTNNMTRIYNDNVCIFCWNDSDFVFDAGNWDWCPVYEGKSKQHICQKSITPLQVFSMLRI